MDNMKVLSSGIGCFDYVPNSYNNYVSMLRKAYPYFSCLLLYDYQFLPT